MPSAEGVLGLVRVLHQAIKLTAYQADALYQRGSRGLLIGNYLILDRLGASPMRMVFKASHRQRGGVVTLKTLPPSFAPDRGGRLRFRRELEAVGRLSHPNIVAVLEADEDHGVQFVVMEYVEGRNLDHLVREQGPLPVREAIDYLIQAARGLAAAHAAGIVHFNIKPSNLMLDNAGTVRVLDLGLSRISEASNPIGQAAEDLLTERGVEMGTIDYMAPEQDEGLQQADHRADIYSLGCTLYYLMTGRSPFIADTVVKLRMAHQDRPVPPLRAARPDAPSALEDAFQKMMAKRPADRPDSMTAVIALLEASQESAAELSSRGAEASQKSATRPRVLDESAMKPDAPNKAGRESSIFAQRDEPECMRMGFERGLDDLVGDVSSEVPLPPLPAPTVPRMVEPPATQRARPVRLQSKRPRRAGWPATIVATGALLMLGAGFAGFVWLALSTRTSPIKPSDPMPDARNARADSAGSRKGDVVTPSIPAAHEVVQTIFDGKTGKGWMLTNRKPLPPDRVQLDGLNPHGTGSYVVVYEKKLGDFVLDLDYKLSKGCNSGVFLRVGDLRDPVNTGIEVALVDSTGKSLVDSGAFYDLVAPNENVQKPAGQWNHMRITAAGSVLAVSLNGKDVSRINLEEWTLPGKRPDGTDHKFKKRPLAELQRTGYLGFQDHGSDCWFRNITLKTPGIASAR